MFFLIEDEDGVKVTGECDSGCGKPAKVWYGGTSAATCGDTKCLRRLHEDYAESCRRSAEESAFRRSMEEMEEY